MSGLFKGIRKAFRKVGKFLKRYWKQILIAAAIVFTAGVAMGYFGAAAAAGGGAAGAAGATAAGTAAAGAGAAAGGASVFTAAGSGLAAAGAGTAAGGALGMGTAGLMAGGTGAGLAAAGGGAALAAGGAVAGAGAITTLAPVAAVIGPAGGGTLANTIGVSALGASAGAFSHAAAASSPQVAEIQQGQQGQQNQGNSQPGSGEEIRDNPFKNNPTENPEAGNIAENLDPPPATGKPGMLQRLYSGKDGTGGFKGMSSFEKMSLLSTGAQMASAAFAPKAQDGSFPMQEQFYGYNKDGRGPGTNVDYDARTGNMVMGGPPQVTVPAVAGQPAAQPAAGQPGHRPIPESFVARNEARNKELDDRMKFITGGG